MTYGQLIDESLRLAGVDASNKSDPCFSDYLSMLNGSISRAFADIEMRNIIPLSCVTVKESQCTKIGSKMSFNTDNIGKNSGIAEITSASESDYGNKVDYYFEDSHTIICDKNGGDIRISYYPKLTVPDTGTSADSVLPLPDSICSLIPYFTAGELLLYDEPSLASYLKNRYELMISRLTPNEGRFTSVSKKFSCI